MSLNKHIVWIIPGFAKDENDELCVPPTQELLSCIKDNYPGLKVSVVALDYPYINKPYQWKGFSIYPCNGKNKTWRKPLVRRKAMRYLHDLHKKNPINVVHSFWLGPPSEIGRSFATAYGIKHICTLMGQDAMRFNRHMKSIPGKNFKTICLTNYHADVYEKSCREKPDYIIPWGIQTKSPTSQQKEIDVYGAGALIALKKYDVWLSVIKKVKKTIPNVKAELAGTGPEHKNLESLIEKHGLSDNVQLTGLLSRTKVIERMGQSRVFLHTSNYESQGYVFLEAMTQDLPIVSTPVGIAKEFDEIAVSNKVDGLAKEVVQYINGRETKKYNIPSIEMTLHQYLEIYNV